MPAAPTVAVIGLRALQRDLARLADPAGGEMAAALAAAGRQAAQPVADAVRNAYPSVSGTLAGSVRVTGSRTGAAVRVGRKSIPYAGPVDFGGYPGDRPYLPDGRYLYPAARAHAADVVAAYQTAVTRVVDRFGWTNTGADPHD
jgi:hypothetical protein